MYGGVEETDVEDRWDAEPLGEAQQADADLRTVIDWMTASETRPPRRKFRDTEKR